MSELSLDLGAGQLVSEQAFTKPIKDRIKEGLQARKGLEAGWQLDLAFAAGKFQLEWHRDQRRLMMPPEQYNREFYPEDRITEYRTHALGELGGDDDRPQLLLRQEDKANEDYQSQLNRAVGFGWDNEWDGDEALEQARRMAVDMGTSAIQCLYDPTVGPVLEDNMPHLNGAPVLDQKQALGLYDEEAGAYRPDVKMAPMRAGRICWNPLSGFNLIVPAGIPDERKFTWECVVQPAPTDTVGQMYPHLAKDLKSDKDIGNALGLDINSELGDARGWGGGPGKAARMQGHVWLYRYYERPTQRFEKGRVVVLVGNKMMFGEQIDELPYVSAAGEYRSGIAYFHWWRVTGRFWSRSLVSALRDIQRSIDEISTLKTQIIKRGLPYVVVEEGSGLEKRKGIPVEVLQIKPQSSGPPVLGQGVGPGPWMQAEMDAKREALEHASGIRAARLGENPANVTTYSQLALIYEADQTKRQQINRDHKRKIKQLVEDSIYDMRRYWGPEKQIMLAGDEQKVEAFTFNATKIPAMFIVEVARGTTQPRTQAAKLKLIDDIAQYSLNSQQPLPVSWVKGSYEAGNPLDLPDIPSDDQVDKAQLENHQMLLGNEVQPQYYDPIQVHVPIHRSAQIQAEQVGDVAAWNRIEQHIQMHSQLAAQNAQDVAGQMPQMPGGPGQLPPGAPGDQGGGPGHPQPGPPGQPQPPGEAQPAPGPPGDFNLHVPLTVQMPPSEPANVSVAPANVHVPAPEVNVHVPEAKAHDQHVTFERDEMGRIIGAKVKKHRGR